MTWGMPMQILKVGDKTEDDSLVVLDEDRLCYSVRSISNGGVGVRTISKALLAEWIEAYKKTPNAPSQVVREQLVGKSDIDRFEYGYAGTLAKMAKMVLGRISVVRPNLEEMRRNEFYDWMLRVEKKSPKTAKDTSGTYLPSISDNLAPRTASVWHGLREYLYNEKPAKKIVKPEILTLSGLRSVKIGSIAQIIITVCVRLGVCINGSCNGARRRISLKTRMTNNRRMLTGFLSL